MVRRKASLTIRMLAPGFIFALWSTLLVLVVCARNEVLIQQATASTSTAIPAISPIAIAPSQNWCVTNRIRPAIRI